MVDTNSLPAVREPRQLARQVGEHRVSQRTSPADWMDGRKVPLTPGATLRFSSLGFVYTGLAESIAGHTFTQPPHPSILTGAVGREAFVRGFSNETIIGILGPNPTQERFRLTAYYLTNLAFQASRAEPLAWGGVHGAVPRDGPPWTARPLGRPGGGLRQQHVCDRCHLWVYDDSEGTDHAAAQPHAGVQRLHGLGIEQLRTGASIAPPNDRHSSMSSRRPSTSSTRSWPFFTKSLG
jgi:hypothetical protein